MPKPRPLPAPVAVDEADSVGDTILSLAKAADGHSADRPIPINPDPRPIPAKEPVVRVTIVLPESKHRRLRRALFAHETNFQKAGEAWVDSMIESGEAIAREGKAR